MLAFKTPTSVCLHITSYWQRLAQSNFLLDAALAANKCESVSYIRAKCRPSEQVCQQVYIHCHPSTVELTFCTGLSLEEPEPSLRASPWHWLMRPSGQSPLGHGPIDWLCNPSVTQSGYFWKNTFGRKSRACRTHKFKSLRVEAFENYVN